MDLHAWITQQVDAIESTARLITPGGYAPDEWRIEPSRSGRWTHLVAYSRLNNEPPEAAMRDGDQPVALVQAERNEDQLIAMHGPAAVLRRCEADRRILAIHTSNQAIYTTTYTPDACHGCGTEGICDDWITEHINDCPILLALAHAHGITDETLAQLDRPQPPAPASQVRRIDNVVIAATRMADLPAALRGPNWKP